MPYKVGYYATVSPFYSSKMALWRLHDASFQRLCDEYDVEWHVVMPVVGGQTFCDRLYNGDRSVLYPTIQSWKIVFHEDLDDNIELDALYLDDLHTYFKTQVKGKEFTVQQQKDYICRLIERMIRERKPIIFSDTDGFTTEVLNDTPAHMLELFQRYKDYDKLKVTSPFHNPVHKNFYLIPFEVDPDKLQPIRPKSQREFLLRYVGIQYYRTHFIPLFDKLSKVGRVRVNGSGWNPYKHLAPDVEWQVKIMMTPEGVNQVYGDSVVALTGRSTFNAERGQEIYLYRWKEYLTAGTLIIPENLPSYTSKLPEGSITFDDVLSWDVQQLKDYFDMSDEEYERIVTAQREKALEFFGVDNWVPVFREMLEI